MPFRDPPISAAWEHVDARRGFEVVVLRPADHGYRLEGTTAAVEADEVWAVGYVVAVDGRWRTVTAEVSGRSAEGARDLVMQTDGRGHWQVDGRHLPALDGCMDVDLESSAVTNALPIHRLDLAVGAEAAAPAAYVRAADLSVERLEQQYRRLADRAGCPRYHYSAPAFDFECELVYDASGLVVDYPGIATRAA